MVTRLLGRVYKTARNKAAARTEKPNPPAQQTEIGRQILDLLIADRDANRKTIVRDVHLRLGLSQPPVLRSIRDLEHTGHIWLDSSLHDPLGSAISLARPTKE